MVEPEDNADRRCTSSVFGTSIEISVVGPSSIRAGGLKLRERSAVLQNIFRLPVAKYSSQLPYLIQSILNLVLHDFFRDQYLLIQQILDLALALWTTASNCAGEGPAVVSPLQS